MINFQAISSTSTSSQPLLQTSAGAENKKHIIDMAVDVKNSPANMSSSVCKYVTIGLATISLTVVGAMIFIKSSQDLSPKDNYLWQQAESDVLFLNNGTLHNESLDNTTLYNLLDVGEFTISTRNNETVNLKIDLWPLKIQRSMVEERAEELKAQENALKALRGPSAIKKYVLGRTILLLDKCQAKIEKWRNFFGDNFRENITAAKVESEIRQIYDRMIDDKHELEKLYSLITYMVKHRQSVPKDMKWDYLAAFEVLDGSITTHMQDLAKYEYLLMSNKVI